MDPARRVGRQQRAELVPVLRRFGNDLGFVSLVIYGSAALYTATLLVSLMLGENIMGEGVVFDISEKGWVGTKK